MLATPSLIVALLLAAGLLLCLLAVARLRRRRLMAASGALAGGGICLALGLLALSLALNLYTYQRLTHEQPVARLQFERLGPQRFRVQLRAVDAPTRSYVLTGTQWRLAARVLKWHPWATLLGFDARYRLDRLSGRYGRIERARHAPHTVYDLSSSRGLDIWQAAHYLPDWLPLVDARFGSATYVPMADGARYAVTLSQSGGLVARAQNAAARAALRQW